MDDNEYATHLKQFRQQVYQNFNKRADTLMELVDALCSNTTARSVVELSLNPAFRRTYSALFTALDEWEPEKEAKNLAQLAAPWLPPPEQYPFWLFGVDVTSQARVFAPTLDDRSYVYLPNVVKGNKPVTIGHAYTHLSLIPERKSDHGSVWIVPLSIRRVGSDENKEIVGADQMTAMLEDESLPFHGQLCAQVGDSSYGKAAFLAKNREKENLVSIVRASQKRTFYRQAVIVQPDGQRVGHPTWYGPAFKLADETTWHAPDAAATTTWASLSRKKYRVEIEAWDNMLMKGQRKPAVLPMHRHPFTLVRIRLFDDQGKLAFKRPLWVIVMGPQRSELSLTDCFYAYQRRYDLEHFFRFGKQHLLLADYQTPETEREEKWWLCAHLAYLQLWMTRQVAQHTPRPWETAPAPQAELSAAQVQRDFARIIRQFGTPARVPKPRGIPSGRPRGTILPRRYRQPVVYKGKNTT